MKEHALHSRPKTQQAPSQVFYLSHSSPLVITALLHLHQVQLCNQQRMQ